MEPKKRNTWIVVIAVLVIACCCVLALTAGAIAWLTSRNIGSWEEPFDLGDLGGAQRERVEQTFAVGAAPDLEITNFAGAITIRSGEEELIRVVATKRASSQSRLDRITVDMQARGGDVVIRTRKDFDTGNASVDLEITVPAGSRVSVDTGAGEVNVRGVTGQIDIHSGAGSVDVRDAQGTAQVGLGAGQIRYEGTPSGDCRFETGVGEIILRLPESPNVRIDVGSGLGSVDVEFDVAGSVALRSANGVIGDGHQGSIFAHTGVGSVRVEPW
jgi:DUF4097 and DUF4098 domain-containing protein YvlB